jgi:hypothetical protein
MDLVLGSLVYRLPAGVTLAYDLCLGNMIACWKGIIDTIHVVVSIKSFHNYLGSLSQKKFIYPLKLAPKV